MAPIPSHRMHRCLLVSHNAVFPHSSHHGGKLTTTKLWNNFLANNCHGTTKRKLCVGTRTTLTTIPKFSEFALCYIFNNRHGDTLEAKHPIRQILHPSQALLHCFLARQYNLMLLPLTGPLCSKPIQNSLCESLVHHYSIKYVVFAKM